MAAMAMVGGGRGGGAGALDEDMEGEDGEKKKMGIRVRVDDFCRIVWQRTCVCKAWLQELKDTLLPGYAG